MNIIDETFDNLRKRGYEVKKFDTGIEACKYLENSIVGKNVGFGGSTTLKELDIYNVLSKNNSVYWHWENGYSDRIKSMLADVYITSANAISRSGEIVNIDGTGNRVAATFFGPQKVIYVIGKNKIAESCDAAIWRARNIACPQNAIRCHANTPCAKTGDRCYDCDSPNRICWGMSIMWGPMYGGVTGHKTEVILIDENYGF